MSNDNRFLGDPQQQHQQDNVSTREIDQLRQEIHDDFQEVKQSLLILSDKVDLIRTQELPAIKEQTLVLSTKAKLIAGVLVSAISTIVSVAVALVKTLL